jgi:hypothetical protein
MIELSPGEPIKRTELHDEYGGRRQGGISPSRESDNVFVITAPERGERYGYVYDGWGDDGFLHYTGEGQVGDQQMTQGNRAVRDHEHDRPSRELHAFEAHGTQLEYLGQFRYHDHYEADAPEVDNGPTRKVVVFRLEQLTGSRTGPTRTRLDRLGPDPVKEVPVEQYLTERMVIEGDREPYEAERREQRLVQALAGHLERRGHEVCRLQFRPDDEAAPLYCDLYDKTANVVYEAKGTVTRGAMRMAIGQLADYSRLIDPSPGRSVLMPERPRPDLMRLAESQGLDVLWPGVGEFADEEGSD